MPLELPKAVPWKPLGAGTLAHCWGTDAALAALGTEEENNVPWVGFPRAWQCHCPARE